MRVCDENIQTVIEKKKSPILTEYGVKRVGQISSTERGSLVTIMSLTNASGNFPIVIIFLRIHSKCYRLQYGPKGALSFVNQDG